MFCPFLASGNLNIKTFKIGNKIEYISDASCNPYCMLFNLIETEDHEQLAMCGLNLMRFIELTGRLPIEVLSPEEEPEITEKSEEGRFQPEEKHE